MSRDSRLMQLALKVAELSSHPRFPMGAIIAHGSRVIAIGTNKYKTHPLQKSHHNGGQGISIHAELDAILKITSRQLRGGQMYIARLLHDGSPGNARPCVVCRNLLLTSSIYVVCYSIGGDRFVQEDLRYEQKDLEEDSL